MENNSNSGGNCRPPNKPNPRFRAYFTSRSGKRFYAADYGYKGWPIG